MNGLMGSVKGMMLSYIVLCDSFWPYTQGASVSTDRQVGIHLRDDSDLARCDERT